MDKIGFARGLAIAASALLLVAAASTAIAEGGNPKPKLARTDTDTIDVIGHLALPDAAVSAITISNHWRREFLELEDAKRGLILEADVTDPAHPSIARELHPPAQCARFHTEVVIGEAALLAEAQVRPAASPGSVSIVSFADRERPTVVRQFNAVSAIRIHAQRGLIYLVNPEGLWVLQQNPAPDRDLEAWYGKYVLYNH